MLLAVVLLMLGAAVPAAAAPSTVDLQLWRFPADARLGVGGLSDDGCTVTTFGDVASLEVVRGRPRAAVE